MNLANKLTVSRFFLTVLFVIVLSTPWQFQYLVALILFVAAGLTDYVDGMVARKFGMVTDFGKLMDPLADKIMTTAAFICLVSVSAIPAWVAIIIISREFLITGLRLVASSKGVILPAEALGKHKTSWQIATVVFFLALLSLNELGWDLREISLFGRSLNVWTYGGWLMSGITVVLTIYSGARYAWKHRRLIEMQ